MAARNDSEVTASVAAPGDGARTPHEAKLLAQAQSGVEGERATSLVLCTILEYRAAVDAESNKEFFDRGMHRVLVQIASTTRDAVTAELVCSAIANVVATRGLTPPERRNWFAQEPQLAALIAVGDAASTTVASNNWTRALGMLLTNNVELKRHVLHEYPSVLSKLVQLLDGAGTQKHAIFPIAILAFDPQSCAIIKNTPGNILAKLCNLTVSGRDDVRTMSVRALIGTSLALGHSTFLPTVDAVGVKFLKACAQSGRLGGQMAEHMLLQYKCIMYSLRRTQAQAEADGATPESHLPLRWTHPSHDHALMRRTDRSAGCDVCGQACQNATYCCAEGEDYDVCAPCILGAGELTTGLPVTADDTSVSLAGDAVEYDAATETVSWVMAGLRVSVPRDELLNSEEMGVATSTHLARAMSVEHAAYFLAGPSLQMTLRALATQRSGRNAGWLLERLHQAFRAHPEALIPWIRKAATPSSLLASMVPLFELTDDEAAHKLPCTHLTYPGLLHLLAALVLPDTDAPDPDSDAALIGLATYPTAVPAMLSEPLNLVAGSSVGSNAITAQEGEGGDADPASSNASAKDNRAVKIDKDLLKPWLDMVERLSFVDPATLPLLTTDQCVGLLSEYLQSSHRALRRCAATVIAHVAEHAEVRPSLVRALPALVALAGVANEDGTPTLPAQMARRALVLLEVELPPLQRSELSAAEPPSGAPATDPAATSSGGVDDEHAYDLPDELAAAPSDATHSPSSTVTVQGSGAGAGAGAGAAAAHGAAGAGAGAGLNTAKGPDSGTAQQGVGDPMAVASDKTVDDVECGYDVVDDLVVPATPKLESSGYAPVVDVDDVAITIDSDTAGTPAGSLTEANKPAGDLWGCGYDAFDDGDAAAAAMPDASAASTTSADTGSPATDAGAAADASSPAPVADTDPGTAAAPAQPAASTAASLPQTRDWNTEFRVCAEAVREALTMDEVLKAAQEQRQLQRDFKAAATAAAQVIVEEMLLPVEDRRVPPVDAGGVAGGIKYIASGIFFKFVETSGLYASYSQAMKAANHEYRSLNAMRELDIDGLQCPYQLLVDVHGFRCSASPLLPIGSSTLVYGSDDAARTVNVTDVRFNALMAKAATRLNLAAHFVGPAHAQTMVHVAADLEGHLGTDGRFYVCDTARLFPPLPPDRAVRGSHLTRLMRPEAVKHSGEPLSSDAFTRFGIHRAREHNAHIRAATKHLVQERLPAAASKLNGDLDISSYDIVSLVQELQGNGCNVHMLGMLRALVRQPPVRAVLLTEMVARTAKDDIMTIMRNTQRTVSRATSKRVTSNQLIPSIVAYLNDLCSRADVPLWGNTKVALRHRLCAKFPHALAPAERDPTFDLRRSLSSRVVLLERVATSVGVQLRPGTIERLVDAWAVALPPGASVQQPTSAADRALALTDVVAIVPRCKEPGLVPQVQHRGASAALQYQADSKPHLALSMLNVIRPLAQVTSAPTGGAWLKLLVTTGIASFDKGDPAAIRTAWSEHCEAAAAAHGSLSVVSLASLRNTGHGHSMAGNYPAACAVIDRVATTMLKVHGGFEMYARMASQTASYTMIQGTPDTVKAGIALFKQAYDVITTRVSKSPALPAYLAVLGFIGRIMQSLASPGNPTAPDIFTFVDAMVAQLCGEAHPLRLPVLLGHGRLLNAIGQTEAGIAKAKEAWAVHEACYPGDAGVKDVASADVAGFLGLMSGRIGDEPGAKQWLARSVAVFTGALAPAEGAPDTSMWVVGSRHALTSFIYFPHVFGELAMRHAGEGEVEEAERLMAAGMRILRFSFKTDPGLPSGVAALERYWPAIRPRVG